MHAKKILFPLFLLLLLSAFGCNEGAPKPKVGVVDSSKAFQESKAGKDGVAYLDALGKDLQAELAALQLAAEKEDTDDTRTALQQGFNQLQQRFGAEQQQVMNKVTDAYQKAVDAVRAEEGLEVVLGTDAAVSFDSKADITKKVIDKMNAAPVAFERIQPESAPGKTPLTNGTQPSSNGTQPSANATKP